VYVADSGNEAASASERHPVVSVPLKTFHQPVNVHTVL